MIIAHICLYMGKTHEDAAALVAYWERVLFLIVGIMAHKKERRTAREKLTE